MDRRLSLQTTLEAILGSENVYFQPPEKFKFVYPCIVYSRDGGPSQFADNIPYKNYRRYSVTVIDINPDSTIPEKVAMLPICSFDRHYIVDNLHHDVYNLYY